MSEVYPIIMMASDIDYEKVNEFCEWMARYINKNCWADMCTIDDVDATIAYEQTYREMLEYMLEQT